MEELYNLGISETTLKSMLEINPELKEITNQEVIIKKLLLEEIKCTNNQILNIISSNPVYLSRTKTEIINLIDCLNKHNFKCLNILFETNPYILNLEPFEINNYINNRLNNGELHEDIIDDLDSNPQLFNEM